DPRDVAAEAEADDELHPHRDATADAAHQPHDVRRLAARWHEINEVDGAVVSLETRFQDEGVAAVAARGAPDRAGGRDQPTAIPAVAKDSGKAGIGIESRPAQPVDRAVAADERGRLTITDQPVIFDPAGQSISLVKRPRPLHSTLLSRPFLGRRLQPVDINLCRDLVDA